MNPHLSSSPNAPPLRSDAQRNRMRLLAAAEKIFLECGAAATLDDVARSARVGIGTLYRRFPTREALLAAMCDDRLQVIARCSKARKEPDPVVALRVFVEEIAAVTSAFRGLAGSIGVILSHPSNGCAATTIEGNRLLLRAKKAGRVREDVTMADIVCIVGAAAAAGDVGDDPPARIGHVVSLFFDGLASKL